MTSRLAAAAALCVAVTLVGCRKAETPNAMLGDGSTPSADAAGGAKVAPAQPAIAGYLVAHNLVAGRAH